MPSKKRFLGRNARLYYNAGTYESPTWTRIDTRKSLSITNGTSAVDVTAEDSGGETWEQVVRHARALDFEAFQLEADTDNTVLLALESKYDSFEALEFAVAHGAIETPGTRLRRLPDLQLHQADMDYDSDSAAMLKCQAKPSPSENAPTTSTVSE